jgi:Rod binding domain-containing protein
MSAAISNTLAAISGENTPSPRLVKASHDFEAMMLKELLKPLNDEASSNGDDSGSGSGSALGEYASEALGRALSQQGGFGIAKRILHELSQTGNTDQSGTVTTKDHVDTVVRALK